MTAIVSAIGMLVLLIKGIAGIPVLFDGHVSPLEYQDGQMVRFTNGHGTVTAFVKRTPAHLCFAFIIPDETVHNGDDIVVMLDTKNAKAAAPTADCIRAYIRRKPENSRMHKGDGKAWVNDYGDWEYRSTSYASGWEVECRYPVASLPGGLKQKTTLGAMFRIWDNEPQKVWTCPAEGADENKPSTWGTLTLEP